MKHKDIVINKRLLKQLGIDDYREFVIQFGDWAYTTDFTYRDNIYEQSFQRLLRAFVEDLTND
jgi:hypothetical protein